MTEAKPKPPLTEDQIAEALDKLSDGRVQRLGVEESRRGAAWSLGLPQEMIDIIAKDALRLKKAGQYRSVVGRKKQAKRRKKKGARKKPSASKS